MAFGIPSADQISAIIKDGIAQVQATGVQLEDHAAQAIHDQLHASLSEAIAGIRTDEQPILDGLNALNAKADEFLVFLKRMDGAKVTLALGSPQ